MDIYTLTKMFRNDSAECQILYLGDLHKTSIENFLDNSDFNIIEKNTCKTIDYTVDIKDSFLDIIKKIANIPDAQCVDIKKLNLPQLQLGKMNGEMDNKRKMIMVNGNFNELNKFHNYNISKL